jgi:uncharacterized protein YhfF
MDDEARRVLEAAFPDEAANYFEPMLIGDTPESADEGAALILDGTKTATSSPDWDYPDGLIPFVGALSVLLDGKGRARAIVRTWRVTSIPFGELDEDFARAYGEGERTLAWFRTVIGDWYRRGAARHGVAFSDETPVICEWIEVVRRL